MMAIFNVNNNNAKMTYFSQFIHICVCQLQVLEVEEVCGRFSVL